MKRIVNFRPMFLAFIGLILGILFNILLMATSGAVAKVVMVLLGVLFLVLFVGFLLSLLVCENKHGFFVWLRLQKTVLLILVVSTVVGNGYTALKVLNYWKYEDFPQEYEITGQVSDFSVERETYTLIVLTSVSAEAEGKVVPVRGQVGLYLYQTGLLGEEIFSNNTMTFRGQIDKLPFKNSRNFLSKYETSFVYTASMVSGSYSLGEGRWQLDERVRDAFRSVQSQHLPREISQLSFSLLFGGSNNLSADLMESFSVSGVVHIISVSGLHVAVLMAVLFWVLRKLRAPKWLQLILMTVLLAFYAYLCSWVSTVLRSAIMGIVLMTAMFMGERYDMLSALSFSGIVVLLISPLQLFTLGFQLSFVCMFAIIALAPHVGAALRKIKIPNSLAGPLAVTLAVTALTLPVVAHHFNNLAVYSVLGNLLAVPIMSLAFILLLVISLLVMALPWFSFLFVIPHILLHFSILILKVIMSFPSSSVTVFSDGYFSLFAILLLVYVAHFVMLRRKTKTLIVSMLSLVVAVGLVVGNLNAKFTSYQVFTMHQSSSNVALFTTSDNTKMLVGSALEMQELKVLTNSLRIRQLDCVVANDFSFKNLSGLKEICNEFAVRDLIIVYDSAYELDLSASDFGVKSLQVVLSQGDFNYKNFNFCVIMYENSVIATQVSLPGKDVLLLKSGIVVKELNHLATLDLGVQNYIFVARARTNVRNYDLQAQNFVVIKSKPNANNGALEIEFGQVARLPL